MRRRARRRVTGERGAAVVEFAIVLPVMMMLILGMVSGATAWNQSQSIGHGGQVGARFASTVPLPTSTDDMDDWLDDVIDRSIAASSGTMDAGTAGRAVCVAYVDPAGAAPDKTASRRLDAAGTRTLDTTECFSDGQGTTAKRVQVVMERTGIIEIGFHRQTLNLRRTIVYRFEADLGL
jgi:Flp pilus assembly protein TadG